MLVELSVADLGVISFARIPFGDGMTALTGETGAGKTMVVEALDLLCGGRADASRVRDGADQAVIEGLFVSGDTEWALRRVVPANGRSRSYVNGEISTTAMLGEITAGLIEIHGQHAQQSLLLGRHQREALDVFAEVDRSPLEASRRRIRGLEAERDELGGDERVRRREVDLLEYQVAEIESVAPRTGEPDALEAEEDLLAGAVAHAEAAAESLEMILEDGRAADLVAHAAAALADRAPFAGSHARLVELQLELSDCASEIRDIAGSIEPDDDRLALVRARRQQLIELFRKYGDTPDDVQEFAEQAHAALERLRTMDARCNEIDIEIDDARAELVVLCSAVGEKRRAAAPRLGDAIAGHLDDLALSGASVLIDVLDTDDLPGAGDDVEILLSANPGSAPAGLARVASGGELSRVMLALRLVLSGGPGTMVFDEVDAGVGGATANAVGAALSRLAAGRQVLVVTHLAQVAAAADHQVVVEKQRGDDSTVTELRVLSGEQRVIELSRMLSGSPGSSSARAHAEELLTGTDRGEVART